MRKLSLALRFTLVATFGFASASLVHWFREGLGVTVNRLSPDETKRARLVEVSPSWYIDRNFRIVLDDLIADQSSSIFRSPDESRKIGTERLIWSKDGTKLLLVGRHFFVKDEVFLDNGDLLYFLYDLPSGQSWCNADFPTHLPPLKAETIAGVEFTEPVVLKTP